MGTKNIGVGSAVPQGVTTRIVPGSDGKYVAGSDGHIYCYSRAKVNSKKPYPFRVSEFIASTGYPSVAVIRNGKKTSTSVHTMICSAFHGPKKMMTHEVRHMDGDKKNNLPSNLRWGTPADNEADKRRHGTVAQGSRQGIAKLNEEAVRILRIAIPSGLWNPIDAAKVFGVDPSTIRTAVRGKQWKHV